MTVHSSLSAVGSLAETTGTLARAGISVNPVTAYYHDHLLSRERADSGQLMN
ncbi:MAG: ACT domain-containing protein [Anaerolineae bacterium]